MSRAALERAAREQGAQQGSGEHRGSTEAQQASRGGAVRERFWLLREPNLAAPYSATAAFIIYPTVLPGSACCCLDSYSFPCSWFHFVLTKDEGPPPKIIEKQQRTCLEPVPRLQIAVSSHRDPWFDILQSKTTLALPEECLHPKIPYEVLWSSALV